MHVDASGINQLTERIIGACIEVHRYLGPGLLESAYESALALELETQGMGFERQPRIPVRYKGVELEEWYRADVIVERAVVLELKSVDVFHPVHSAQLLTYLKVSGLRVGLLINFNGTTLRGHIRRVVNDAPDLVRR